MRKPNTSCSVCKKQIYRRPLEIRSGSVYCSLQCCGISQRKQRICHVCTTKYIGAKRTCSRSCANTARAGINYTKENRFNKAYRGALLKESVAKERGGVCEQCGENNYAILQVHHKKERYNGGTDHITNLELLCPNCHASHHLGRSLYKKKKMI
jgi:5-methylcytosine-specific restriction endonuclease McrA